jgi:hypothetical protein
MWKTDVKEGGRERVDLNKPEKVQFSERSSAGKHAKSKSEVLSSMDLSSHQWVPSHEILGRDPCLMEGSGHCLLPVKAMEELKLRPGGPVLVAKERKANKRERRGHAVQASSGGDPRLEKREFDAYLCKT